MSENLVAFFRARLDEAAEGAWSVHDVAKCEALLYEEDMADAAAGTPDCDCGYPARVRREVEADRRILAEYEAFRAEAEAQREARGYVGPAILATSVTLRKVVQIRAAVHGGHPDYQPEWARQD